MNWLERALAASPKEAPTPQAEPQADNSPSAIPDDFVWAAPFVDQQVHKFFRKHWDEYTRAVLAVVNEQMPMEQFALAFGLRRISDWVNGLLRLPDEHPHPCSKQNINASAAYGVLVKAFNRNPREHEIVQRLQHGRSEAAQAILDEFLAAVGPAL